MKNFFFLILFCCANNFTMASPKNDHFNNIPASDPVKKIVKEIEKANIYEYTATVGFAGTASQQNIHYEELLKTASTDELIKLATKNKNAVVRLYAYRAIVQKFKEVPKDILNQFNNDTSVVNTLRGCIAEKTTVKVIAESLLY